MPLSGEACPKKFAIRSLQMVSGARGGGAHQCNSWSQEAELTQNSVHESIQRSQAQDGKNVASVHNEWVLCDAKDLNDHTHSHSAKEKRFHCGMACFPGSISIRS